MSFVTKNELGQIWRSFKKTRYSQVYAVAEAYVREKLPEHYRQTTDKHVDLQIEVVSQLCFACRDFLLRDSADVAREYQRKSEVLKDALGILEDEKHFFNSLISCEGITVDRRSVNACALRRGGFVRLRGPADLAVWAIGQVAGYMRWNAEGHARYKKNITFFYCLGWRLARKRPFGLHHSITSAPLPSAGQAQQVFTILLQAMREVAPHRLAEIKTDYDARHNGNEIRRLMKAGAAARQSDALGRKGKDS